MKLTFFTQQRQKAGKGSGHQLFRNRLDLFKTAHFGVYFLVLTGALLYGLTEQKRNEFQISEKELAIENALYTRAEFFGAMAIVPFPTTEARERLASAAEKFPGDAEILLKLSELEEKLGRFDEAEQKIKVIRPENLEALANFYERRGQFDKKAEILEQILERAAGDERGQAFSNLINLAKKHSLKKYLSADFYQKIIARDKASFSVFWQYLEKLAEEKNYDEALKILAENKKLFPDANQLFIEQEISILTSQNKINEAAQIYEANFNPLWSEEESQKFYDFLRDHDHYRSYQSRLDQSFRKNAADYQTAIRLIHFQRDESEEIEKIVRRLENARAEKRVIWQPDELLTISHFLINAGSGREASRFLYTLCADFKLEKQSPLRRKVLYQLFELLSDAGSENLALTRGNLKFYENIARADLSPGITTGILSLIFSDSNPRLEFESKETAAVKLFNRAAAYRIFNEFKSEYPDSPELAQMYLDIIRVYTTALDLETASAVLTEFEQKFADFNNFPDAALKLADAFITAQKFEREREIYRKLLDFLGKSEKAKFPKLSLQNESQELTEIKPLVIAYPPQSNPGAGLSPPKRDYYYYDRENPYQNYLSRNASEISYAEVLDRLIASLARENKTQEILNFYNQEIEKYPAEQRLYEQMLQWLGQTNLTEKQWEIYQKALLKFPEKTWQDRFARWLIRGRRQADFENYSRGLVESFDDLETQAFLKQFIDNKEFEGAKSANGQLFFALYSLAHRRFPHNITFVKGLLRYYRQNKQETEWRRLLAEYYFESSEIRQEFLADLAKKGEIRTFLKNSEPFCAGGNEIKFLPYQLFCADAAAWQSDFEKSIVFYRQLNRLYPYNPQFSESFILLARSFGQQNRKLLQEAADFAGNEAENFPSSNAFVTRAGELQAELGNYEKARRYWEKLISMAEGEPASYLETATVFWDYFQFDDALRTIAGLREKFNDPRLYAFETGAIYEAQSRDGEAVREYLKALESDENNPALSRAKRRLKQLYPRPNFAKEIETAFEKQRRNGQNSFQLVYNFADVLFQLKKQPAAVNLLKKQIELENSRENLLQARRFFQDLEEFEAERFALRRLIKVAENQRDAISFRLQLAENFRENGQTELCLPVLAELVKNFPYNYGVLSETETFFWDIGKRRESVQLLQTARKRARGRFAYQFNRQLARRLVSLARADEAEQILLLLHSENPSDEAVFSELAEVFIYESRPDKLRKTLDETIAAIKKQNLEPRDFTFQTASLRRKMISAFTRLKDYDSASAQYIEIINRQPDNEENLEEAINFARRYGGAENLLEYYRKTAAESFKNYRWNVVLARIYEAGQDFPKAAENYRVAIYNQPEMIELYESLNEIYLKMSNYEAALETTEKMLELSNQDKKFIKQKIEILEKLGRQPEADLEKKNLPAEEIPAPQTLSEQFLEAKNLRLAETEKAIEKYRQAFQRLEQNPFQTTLKAWEITNYVQTVHKADSLGDITGRLWNLRDKLIAEIETPDSVKSGQAREMLKVLDGAFVEAIALEVKTSATGNEILLLRQDIENRSNLTKSDKNQTFSLLENLIARCGFDDLREKILLARFSETNPESRSQSLRDLVNFYRARADFSRVLEILENQLPAGNLEFLKIYAETARLLQNREKELFALRQIFSSPPQADEFHRRYLEIIYENDRAELENLVQNPGSRQLAVINFLLSKNETELARKAIRNSRFSMNWKSSREAEIVLRFNNFNPGDEIPFVTALQFVPIGELVKQTQFSQNQLAGNDWFNLSNKYGRWLFAGSNREKSFDFLPAMIENRPRDGKEQFRLGLFYLERQEFSRALEHLRLSQEMLPDDKSILPYLGAAFFQTGETNQAAQTWSKIIEGENPDLDAAALYLKTLAEFGRAAKARDDLKLIVAQSLKKIDDNPVNKENSEKLRRFVKQASETFSDEGEKTAYFLNLCREAPGNKLLPEILLEEAIVPEKEFGKFYELLIDRADELGNYEHDYEYVSILETVWDGYEAELLLDAEKNFEIVEPENERLAWQRKYLEFFIERQNFSEAEKLVSELEKSLKGHYARPVWLRLAQIRLQLRQKNPALALSLMKKLCGIEISENALKAIPPSPERLNQTLDILEKEKRTDLIFVLQEAFYARQLALEQFSAANFRALANVRFQQGDRAAALRLLQILADFSAPEKQAELAELSFVAKFSVDEKVSFEKQIDLTADGALKIAAETAAELGFDAEAINFRDKLFEIAPDDVTNRIERARLVAQNKRTEEAVNNLLEIISDRRQTRKGRWQSVIILAQITGPDADLWRKISSENQNLRELDAEMWNALEAFSFYQTGRPGEACNFLETNDFTPHLKFLKAVFEKQAGLNETALQNFKPLFKDPDELAEIFGFWEEETAFQLIRLYLKTCQPRAALEIAKTSKNLKAGTELESEFPANLKFSTETLAARARQGSSASRRELLDLLTNAAENSGELPLAIEFEKARFNLLKTSEEQSNSTRRLKTLQQKLDEQTNRQNNAFVVTESVVADF